MPRKVRGDKTVGKVEEDLGLSTGAYRGVYSDHTESLQAFNQGSHT